MNNEPTALAQVEVAPVSLLSPEEAGKVAEAAAEREIAVATGWARALKRVIEERGLSTKMGSKTHVDVEGWQLLGQFAHVSPSIKTAPILGAEGGEPLGYLSHCDLLDDVTGRLVSSGEMTCFKGEFPTQGKKGLDWHRAAMSSAETWSVGKAYRNKFGWVMKMAGYEATPSEEMSQPSGGDQQASDEGHGVCPEHSVAWFQRGRMPSPAHPLPNNQWCNKPKPAASGPQSPAEPREQDSAPQPPDEAFQALGDAPEEQTEVRT